MGSLILEKMSQVIMDNNTWLYYYSLIIYLGYYLLLDRASFLWQGIDLLYLKRYALDTDSPKVLF